MTSLKMLVRQIVIKISFWTSLHLFMSKLTIPINYSSFICMSKTKTKTKIKKVKCQKLLHPRFSVDYCNWRVGCITLNLWKIYGFDNEMYSLLINVIVYEYRSCINLECVIKLLTSINVKFCSEILMTRSLVRIDVVKEKMLNREF